MAIAKKLSPIPPGEILAEEFMKPNRISQNRLARDLDINPARVNDIVQVIAGDDKGKRGKVLSVDRPNAKVTVQGVNLVYRHMKPSRANPQGGRLSKEMPISASNVLLFCPNCRRGVRLGRRYTPDGRKERYCKKCGTGLGTLAKGRTKYVPKA